MNSQLEQLVLLSVANINNSITVGASAEHSTLIHRYGVGRRGEQISQFLLGLAVPSNAPGEPTFRWITFARVGSGTSDDERAAINAHLQPLLKEGNPPPCIETTGREKPDAWVTDPAQSIVLEIQADLRAILSNNFATGYSLRFPTVQGIRWDKPAAQATTDAELRTRMSEGMPGNSADRPAMELESMSPSSGTFRSPSRKRGTRPSLADDSPATKRKREGQRLTVAAAFQPIDTSKVSVCVGRNHDYKS